MNTHEETLKGLVLLYKQRRQFMNAEQRLKNQHDALARTATGKLKGKKKVVMTPAQIMMAGDVAAVVNPFLSPAIGEFHKQRLAVERDIRKLARTLPAWEWVEGVRGISDLGFGVLVGAAGGDVGRFRNPSSLWKRFGVAVMDGRPQRRIAGTTAEKKLEAMRHGYSPVRRAVAHMAAEGLLRQNDNGYRSLYDERKAYEHERNPEITKGHAHKRALRFMVKRFLLDLWVEWRRAGA